MEISVERLEELLNKLQSLTRQLRASDMPLHASLDQDDPLVQLANNCEFMLPSPLDRASLLSTAERKIENVHLLLDRARHQLEIPEAAQNVMENEYLLIRREA
jgi:hypothetical protein